MYVPLLPQLLAHVLNDVAGDSKADSLTPTGLRKDERINPHQQTFHVDQRAAAVPRVDGCVRLDISQRTIVANLSGGRTDHSHGERVLQPEGTAQSENDVTLA